MPGEDIYSWSTTAANNDDADTSINWREGMARAAVNDSSRSSMAAVAKFRDLLKGTIVTSGTANAQTFASGVGYTVVPTGLRALLKVGPLLTNTGTTTLSMDGIAASPVKNKAGADLIGGEIVAGGYIEVIYDGTNWILAADGKEKLNTTGGTITGDLAVTGETTFIGAGTIHQTTQVPTITVQSTSEPNIGFHRTGVLACQIGMNASNQIAIGGWSFPTNACVFDSSGNVSALGTFYGSGVSITGGNIATSGDFYSENGNCFLRGSVPQLTLWDIGTAVMGIQSASGSITFGHANTTGALTDNLMGIDGNTGHFTVFVGTGFKPGGGAWDAYSDARAKNVIGNYSAGLAEVTQLQPVRYSYKGNDTPLAPIAGETVPYKSSPNYSAATRATEFVGLVAQETEQVMPEMVTAHDGYIDGAAVNDVRTLSTTALTFALVNCIKELLQRIEALEAKA